MIDRVQEAREALERCIWDLGHVTTLESVRLRIRDMEDAVRAERVEVTEAMVLAAHCTFWDGDETEPADVAMRRALTAALEAK